MLRENAPHRHPIAAFVKELFFPAVAAATSPSVRVPEPAAATEALAQASAAKDDSPALRRARRSIDYTPAQQKELEFLCFQLFKRKALVTSGQLQLIGLEKVKQRMGAAWPAVKETVYGIVESAMTRHLSATDIFVRLKDDTYVIIFAEASLAQGTAAADRVAEEVKAQLGESKYGALRDIAVQKQVVETRAADMAHLSPAEALAALTFRRAPAEEAGAAAPKGAAAAGEVRYMPLWDHRKNALTTYVCEPVAGLPPPGFNRDVAMLKHVAAELDRMAKDGRKFLVVCRVTHETLYRQSSFEFFAAVARMIPPEQRRMLVFLVTNIRKNLHDNNGYWFSTELKKICRYVFLDLSDDPSLHLPLVVKYPVDGVGVRLEPGENEELAIGRLRAFHDRATAARVPRTFVFGVNTRSITTSAICMGFDFLGGGAIHEQVEAPDSMHRFRDEDLFSDVMG
jgi:hypothetical protein